MASGVTVTGGDAIRRKLATLAKRFPEAQARALYQEAQVEMTESKRRCPVDTGTLRASGHVNRPVTQGKKTTVDMGYGGAASGYALIVHEDLEANHNSPPFGGGQAKYLESVLMESAPHMTTRIAQRVKFNEEMLR